MNTEKKSPVAIDPNEFAVAEKEAENSKDLFTQKFHKPITYNGITYDKLTFDFGKLTGEDGLAIEDELQAIGKVAIVPTISGQYLVRMAARACTDPVGADIFKQMSLSDYNMVRGAARSFLLRSEL